MPPALSLNAKGRDRVDRTFQSSHLHYSKQDDILPCKRNRAIALRCDNPITTGMPGENEHTKHRGHFVSQSTGNTLPLFEYVVSASIS